MRPDTTQECFIPALGTRKFAIWLPGGQNLSTQASVVGKPVWLHRAAEFIAWRSRSLLRWWPTSWGADAGVILVRCAPNIPGAISLPKELPWRCLRQLERDLSAPDLESQQQAVQHGVDRLPSEQRHLLLLHVNQGLTYRQISAQSGLPEQQVFRQISGAYAQLRIWMIESDSEGRSSTPVNPPQPGAGETTV